MKITGLKFKTMAKIVNHFLLIIFHDKNSNFFSHNNFRGSLEIQAFYILNGIMEKWNDGILVYQYSIIPTFQHFIVIRDAL